MTGRTRRVPRHVPPEVSAALGELPLPVDWSRVRIYREGCDRTASLARRLVLWLSRERAIALGNHVFIPSRCDGDLAIVAHEVTHCAQYQAWGPWRYYTRGAAAQIRHLIHRVFGVGQSPYDYRPAPDRPFESYGIEQQAQIVEDAMRGSVAARAITAARRPRLS